MNISERANQRSEALTAAKLAVRSYSRDPSSTNEEKVREAWLRVRRTASAVRGEAELRKLFDTQAER
ncbi:MAG: hypothetical protein MI920_13410 [Kiloniellales bacterium]|nr:hypothetical protein [Kiloniellales bacterium]